MPPPVIDFPQYQPISTDQFTDKKDEITIKCTFLMKEFTDLPRDKIEESMTFMKWNKVLELKQRFCNEKDAAAANVIFNKKRMEDDTQTLEEAGLVNDSEVRVLLKAPGPDQILRGIETTIAQRMDFKGYDKDSFIKLIADKGLQNFKCDLILNLPLSEWTDDNDGSIIKSFMKDGKREGMTIAINSGAINFYNSTNGVKNGNCLT
jgi:hypothetical protein